MNGKSQQIRLADVFVIGPVMLWAADRLWRVYKERNIGTVALAVFAVATVIFNGRNWLRLRETPGPILSA